MRAGEIIRKGGNKWNKKREWRTELRHETKSALESLTASSALTPLDGLAAAPDV